MMRESPNRPSPPIWGWYVALCVVLALANVGLIVFGFWFLSNESLLTQDGRTPKEAVQFYGLLYIAFGVIFGIGNLILPFLPKKPWMYVLHMTNIIAAGLTCCLAPMAIPIFIGWLKPDAKALFDFK